MRQDVMYGPGAEVSEFQCLDPSLEKKSRTLALPAKANVESVSAVS